MCAPQGVWTVEDIHHMLQNVISTSSILNGITINKAASINSTLPLQKINNIVLLWNDVFSTLKLANFVM
jgi:hypothetical protein